MTFNCLQQAKYFITFLACKQQYMNWNATFPHDMEKIRGQLSTKYAIPVQSLAATKGEKY